jgi:pimeloyl-ACP methyl ester carboxylesterase
MAYFERGNARIYYEDVGQGEPIIANHGLAEDTTYWSEPGVTAALAEHYRVVSLDMRGHGRTIVEGEPKGYDERTMGDDLGGLADHLGIEKFHLLSHATGGMYAVRFGMRHSDRLLSLMLTDTGSETLPTMYHADGREFTEEDLDLFRQMSGETRETATQPPPPFEERRRQWHAYPGVFTFRMAHHPYADRMYLVLDGFAKHRLNQQAVVDFRQTFYSDPDPMAEGLRNVTCPTLILLGEYDLVFLEPSKLMAAEIPDNRHVVMRGLGHMTAIEAPAWTASELLDFLDCVSRTGRANWRGGNDGSP